MSGTCADCGLMFGGWIPTTCPRCNTREAEKIAVATALAHAEGRLKALREALERVQVSGVPANDDMQFCKHCSLFQDGSEYPAGHRNQHDKETLWFFPRLEPACVIAANALEADDLAAQEGK